MLQKKIKKLIRRGKQAQFPFLYSRSSEPPATMYIPSSSIGRGGGWPAAKLRTVSLWYASSQRYRVLCGNLVETLYVGYTLETKSLQYIFYPEASYLLRAQYVLYTALEPHFDSLCDSKPALGSCPFSYVSYSHLSCSNAWVPCKTLFADIKEYSYVAIVPIVAQTMFMITR